MEYTVDLNFKTLALNQIRYLELSSKDLLTGVYRPGQAFIPPPINTKLCPNMITNQYCRVFHYFV